MTDRSVIEWVHEVLGYGTFNHKPRKGLRKRWYTLFEKNNTNGVVHLEMHTMCVC